MNTLLNGALAVAAVVISAQAAAEAIFYEHEDFRGRPFTADRAIGNFNRFGFNDRASSVVAIGDRWEACEDVRFGGRCVVLRPRRYRSLATMELNDRISSVRGVSRDARIDDRRYPAPPVPVCDNRRRGNDAATVGGAVAGGAIGANVGREQQVQTQNMQRCENVPGQARPDCWDVTYTFRGQVHHMQTTNPPGPTVTVNERGEPRA